MFAESSGFCVTRHSHPAWKVVLSFDGLVEVVANGHRPISASGIIVPPQFPHTCTVSSAYVTLLLDPWELVASALPIRIEKSQTRRIIAALGHLDSPVDLAAACAEIPVRRDPALEPRVAHAIREMTLPGNTTLVSAIATEVGLSPPRLRALVHSSVGIALPRLRQWARLRAAVLHLPSQSAAAAAAAAGFADQAHFTRTARSLLGRTPSEIR